MANKKNTAARTRQKRSEADIVNGFFGQLLNIVATAYLALTVVALPLFMSKEKYTAITAAKSGFFSTVSFIVLMCVVFLCVSFYLYAADAAEKKPEKKRLPLREAIVSQPPLLADAATLGSLALFSSGAAAGSQAQDQSQNQKQTQKAFHNFILQFVILCVRHSWPLPYKVT